jgi:hypothetical protein
MTPMQSLKNQFDQLKSVLPDTFKETALNKSEPKTEVVGFLGDLNEYHNKGVKSDFIKTFKAKLNDKDSYSIGFAFKYLNIKEDDQTVQVSLKVGNKEPLYFKGQRLSVEVFREKIIETINKIEALEEKKYAPIVELFKSDFNLLPSHAKKIPVHSQRKKNKSKP